jgi:3-oxoacyl-[acyl-carrier-protein] synthase III
MRFKNVCLSAYAYALPPKNLTSQAIEDELSSVYQTLHIPKGRLEQLTGIRERGVWAPDVAPSQIAAQAGQNLLDQNSVDPKDIDLLIHTGVCRDYLEPATASVVHHLLGLSPHCQLFDLSNACVAFLNGLLVAGSMIEAGAIKKALIVTGENSGPLYPSSIKALKANPSLDLYRKTLASLTLGSAGVAYLLEDRRIPSSLPRASLLGGCVLADSRAHDLCRGFYAPEGGGLRMETDTAALMREGLSLSRASWDVFQETLGWTRDTPDHVITHQISLAHQEKVFEVLELDPKKGYADIDFLGNTGSAAVPLSLIFRKEQGVLKSGDRIALLGIGSGLNTLMLGVEW